MICFTELKGYFLTSPYIGDVMRLESPDDLEELNLNPFMMKVQGIDRTLVDKVFAICDYYLNGNTNRHSRHIYDIYKLLPLVPQTEEFKKLVREVRKTRAAKNPKPSDDGKVKKALNPSAAPGVDVPEILRCLIDNGVYRHDYETVTSRILEEKVAYETVIEAVKAIVESGIFGE